MRDAIIFGIGLITGAVTTAIVKMEKINGPVWYAEEDTGSTSSNKSSDADNQN